MCEHLVESAPFQAGGRCAPGSPPGTAGPARAGVLLVLVLGACSTAAAGQTLEAVRAENERMLQAWGEDLRAHKGAALSRPRVRCAVVLELDGNTPALVCLDAEGYSITIPSAWEGEARPWRVARAQLLQGVEALAPFDIRARLSSQDIWRGRKFQTVHFGAFTDPEF